MIGNCWFNRLSAKWVRPHHNRKKSFQNWLPISKIYMTTCARTGTPKRRPFNALFTSLPKGTVSDEKFEIPGRVK